SGAGGAAVIAVSTSLWFAAEASLQHPWVCPMSLRMWGVDRPSADIDHGAGLLVDCGPAPAVRVGVGGRERRPGVAGVAAAQPDLERREPLLAVGGNGGALDDDDKAFTAHSHNADVFESSSGRKG